MTGCAFNTFRDVYVSGMLSTDVLGVAYKNAAFIDQQHDAQGTLAVSGGTFETKKNLIFGRDGTGVLELSDSGVVKAVDVTVGHAEGQPTSILSFTCDENGVFGSLVADSPDFAESTKLTVDVAACSTARKAKLITRRHVVNVCFLQLAIKSIEPDQSIRLHKGGGTRNGFSWAEGISMRTLDRRC